MSSERDNPLTAKCALLAMLPKPKKAGDQKQTPTTTAAAFGIGGGAINKMNAQNASILPATKLPSSFMALRPRQATAMPSRQNKALDNDDDDDDAEFDMKLAEKLGRVGSGENDDDSSGSEEGPARPMNGPTFVGQKGAKSIGQSVAQITLSRPLGIDYGYSDSSDDDGAEMDRMEANVKDESMDFFGLSNSSSPPPEKRLKMGEEEQTLDAQMFIDDVAPGPSKPVKWAEPDSELNEEQRRRRIAQLRAISDEEAQKLIYDRELAPFGANPLIAQDAVNQIVDVSVDNALGPNVRENLLRNLSGKQMAQLPLGPLPKMKKSDSDKLAKRKHQITHLATVAVSREEQLQEKWADSKQTKKMSRQKYGF